MATHLIDTSVLTAYLFGRRAAVNLIAPWIIQRQAATSILVYGEVIEYLRGRPSFSLLRLQLRQLLIDIRPHFLTYAAMERYADIRRQMRRQGSGLIGDVDTLIAAAALEQNLTVVTADGDFQRVPGLQIMLVARQSL